MSSMLPVCILAGGLGTRLGAAAGEVPKPLVEVAGKPFLCHQLEMLSGHGVTDVVLCVGHLGQMIVSRLGDSAEGVAITYSFDRPGLDGTLGAVRRAAPRLGPRFLVMYGDTYLRLDLARFVTEWSRSALPAGMTVLRNEGRWDRSNAVYSDGIVAAYDKRQPTADMLWIDYGIVGLTPGALWTVPGTETDLSALFGALARSGELFGMEVTERFYEIGTPQSLAETEAFLTGSSR